MVILQASMELWKGLEQSINENAATYRFMMDKLRHAPSRTYIPYHLPINFPNERLEPMGLRLVPDHRVVTLESLQPPKRGPESEVCYLCPDLKIVASRYPRLKDIFFCIRIRLSHIQRLSQNEPETRMIRPFLNLQCRYSDPGMA